MKKKRSLNKLLNPGLLKKKNGFPYHYIYVKENPLSFVTESYEKLLVNLSYVNVDQSYKVIQMTSTIAEEGKTTFVSNFSYLLSKKDYKVIVVDLDLRKPKIHRVVHKPNEHGLTDYLSGKITLDKAINTSKELGCDYILAGEKTSAVTHVLESKKLKDLINELKTRYDYIILDSPPVIAVSDAMYVSKLADGILFLVGQKNDAKKSLVKEAIETLRKNKTPIIGLAMIQVDLKSGAYGYGYSYGYGYTDEQTD